MNISRILLAAALAVAFVSATFANDREQFSVGRLTVESDIDLTGGTLSNGTLVGTTSTSETLTDPAINGRAAVLSSSATAERVVETGSTTNTGIVAFTTPFTGSPVVLTGYATSAATSTVAFATLVNPTNFTANGVGGASITWVAIGTK